MARKFPQKVAILKFEELIESTDTLKNALHVIGVNALDVPEKFVFDEVPKSPKSRKKSVTIEDIEPLIEKMSKRS